MIVLSNFRFCWSEVGDSKKTALCLLIFSKVVAFWMVHLRDGTNFLFPCRCMVHFVIK